MRSLQVAAVPLRLEPVSHPEAARERLLAAVMAAVNAAGRGDPSRDGEPPSDSRPGGEPAGSPPGSGRAGEARPRDGSTGGSAAGARPRLVALPALAGLLALAAVSGETVRWDEGLQELVRRQGAAAAELWCDWASHVARMLGVYVCAGTVLLPAREGFQHVGLVFGPDGRLLARQPQLHVAPPEARLGLVPGDEWTPFTVDGWPAALTVGHDGWVPEVARWMSLDGVRLVVHPAHAFRPANPWTPIAGPWQLVQQTQIYWVYVTPAGALGPREMAPRAAVFAPCEITPAGRGWLADDHSGSPVHASLDGGALAGIRRRYPLARQLNPRLYLAQLVPAYRGIQGGAAGPAGARGSPGSSGEPDPLAQHDDPGATSPALRPRGENAGGAGRNRLQEARYPAGTAGDGGVAKGQRDAGSRRRRRRRRAGPGGAARPVAGRGRPARPAPAPPAPGGEGRPPDGDAPGTGTVPSRRSTPQEGGRP